MNTSMLQRKTEVYRSRVEEWYSMLFPTRNEVRLIQILGGRTLTLPFIRSRETGLPLTFILSRGKVLRREHFRRTGDRLVLFSNDLKMGLAIQGHEYERNIIEAYERDEWLRSQGYHIRYIPARWLMTDPEAVRLRVLQFVNA